MLLRAAAAAAFAAAFALVQRCFSL